MLLYEYRVRDEFEKVRRYAERIRDAFEAQRSADDLLSDVENLRPLYEGLITLLPERVGDLGNFGRHLYFLDYWLSRGAADSCRGDIDDILRLDLPALEEGFRDWCANAEHYDEALASAVGDLIARREYDSAVRKAFVILKSRLVNTFRASPEMDGEQLVNSIFGGTATLTGLEDSERQAIRNLLSGLYGVFRNRVAHTDVVIQYSEADAVIGMINHVLKQIPEMVPTPR